MHSETDLGASLTPLPLSTATAAGEAAGKQGVAAAKASKAVVNGAGQAGTGGPTFRCAALTDRGHLSDPWPLPLQNGGTTCQGFSELNLPGAWHCPVPGKGPVGASCQSCSLDRQSEQ